MNKNILIILPHNIDPETGGVQRVYWNLVPEFRKRGFKVFATYNRKSTLDDKQDVYDRIYYMEGLNIESVAFTDRLSNIIREKNIGIVIHTCYGFQIFDYLSKQKDLKVFFHLHAADFAFYPAFVPLALRRTKLGSVIYHLNTWRHFYRIFPRMNHNNMKWVLLSDGIRKQLKGVYPFKNTNVLTIPNPLPAGKSVDLSAKENIILYVGRVGQYPKNVQALLRIWKRNQALLPNYSLEIVGDGPKKKLFEQKARKMNLCRIHFMGYQNTEAYYKKSKVLCLTSIKEGFPMVLLEAMQSGCVPFVFGSFAAAYDIIDNEKNGFIIKPFDEEAYAKALVDFLSRPKKYYEMMANSAIEKSKKFLVESVCDKWVEAIENY